MGSTIREQGSRKRMKKEREGEKKLTASQACAYLVSPSNGLRRTCAAKLILTTERNGWIGGGNPGQRMRVPLQRCNTQKKNGISLDICPAACGFSTSIQSITPAVHCQGPFSTSSLSSLSCYVVPWPVDNAREKHWTSFSFEGRELFRSRSLGWCEKIWGESKRLIKFDVNDVWFQPV